MQLLDLCLECTFAFLLQGSKGKQNFQAQKLFLYRHLWIHCSSLLGSPYNKWGLRGFKVCCL